MKFETLHLKHYTIQLGCATWYWCEYILAASPSHAIDRGMVSPVVLATSAPPYRINGAAMTLHRRLCSLGFYGALEICIIIIIFGRWS